MRHVVIAEGQSICTAVGAVSGLCGMTGEHLLVGAPSRILEGRVVDPEGEPIDGAELTAIVDPRPLLLAFPRPLDSDTLVAPQTMTDTGGRFAIEVPIVEGLTLCARSDGCASVRMLIAPRAKGAVPPVELTLQRTAPPWRGSGPLYGRVERLDGTPAAGVRVLLGREEAWTDEDGSFTVQMLRGFGPGVALCAALPGAMPFISLDPANELAAFGTVDAPAVLTLGGPSLSITGRVLDQVGNPCSGWLVEIADGTDMDHGSEPRLFVENLARPRETHVLTDLSGAFRLDGLLQRDYVIQAEPPLFSGFGVVMLRSRSIPAGASNVELRLAAQPWITPFHGRLVDLDGIPLANEPIALHLQASLTWPIGSGSLETATTDALGHFEMARVPKTGSAFSVGGTSIPISSCTQIDQEWMLHIAREPNLRLDWERDASPPIEVAALDEEGATLWIHSFCAGTPEKCASVLELHGVRSHLLGVQRSLASLRMRFADDTLETLPVRLETTGLTQISID
jgi:hypothetical protein